MVSSPLDGGPLYTETNMEAWIREPFNAGSALLFFLMAVYYCLQMYRQRNFKLFYFSAYLILAIGGIGGTLYHGFRSHRFFLILDFMPILILILMLSWRLWLEITGKGWFFLVIFLPFFILQRLAFLGIPRLVAIQLSYFMLGMMVLFPLIFILIREKFAGIREVSVALGFFLLALFFRGFDPFSKEWFPMGTHWLWHVFALASVHFLIFYLKKYQH